MFDWGKDKGFWCAVALGMVGAVVLMVGIEKQCRYEEVCE